MIVITVLLLVLFSTKSSGQANQWSNIESLGSNVEPVTGWSEVTPTPTVDPNTSTPGSTISSQSHTEPTIKRKQHNMRGAGFSASGKQTSLSLGKSNTPTFNYVETRNNPVEATNTKLEKSANEIPAVPVLYKPVNVDILDSNSMNTPIVIPDTQMIELNPNSPHAMRISKENQSRLSKQPRMSAGIEIPMKNMESNTAHFRASSSGSRVDSNIKTDYKNNYIIMEPVPKENIVAAQDKPYSAKLSGFKEPKRTDQTDTGKPELVNVRQEYLIDVKRISNEVPQIPLTPKESILTQTVHNNPQVVEIPIDGTMKSEVGIVTTLDTEKSDNSFASQAVSSKTNEPLKGSAFEEPETGKIVKTNMAANVQRRENSGTLADSSIVDSNKPSGSDNKQKIAKDVPTFTYKLATTVSQTNSIKGNSVENKGITEAVATGDETESTSTGSKNGITKTTSNVSTGTSEMNSKIAFELPIEGPVKDAKLVNDAQESSKTSETHLASPSETHETISVPQSSGTVLEEPNKDTTLVKDVIHQSKTSETINVPQSSGTVLEEFNKDSTLVKDVVVQSETSETINVPKSSGIVLEEPSKDMKVVNEVVVQSKTSETISVPQSSGTVLEEPSKDTTVVNDVIDPSKISETTSVPQFSGAVLEEHNKDKTIVNDVRKQPINEQQLIGKVVGGAPTENVGVNDVMEQLTTLQGSATTKISADNTVVSPAAEKSTISDATSFTESRTETGSNLVLPDQSKEKATVIPEKSTELIDSKINTIAKTNENMNKKEIADKNSINIGPIEQAHNTNEPGGLSIPMPLEDLHASAVQSVAREGPIDSNIAQEAVVQNKELPVQRMNEHANTNVITDPVDITLPVDGTSVQLEEKLSEKSPSNGQISVNEGASLNEHVPTAIHDSNAAKNIVSVLDSTTATNTEVVLDSKTSTNIGAVLDSKPEANTEAVLDSKTATNIGAVVESKVATTDAVLDSKASTNNVALVSSNTPAETHAVFESKTATNTEAVVDSTAVTNTEAVLEDKTATKTQADVDSTAAINSESVLDSKAATQDAVLDSKVPTNTEAFSDSNAATITEAVLGRQTATKTEGVLDSSAATNAEAVLDSKTPSNTIVILDSKASTTDAVLDSKAPINTGAVLDSKAVTTDAIMNSKASTNTETVLDSNAAANTEAVLDSKVATTDAVLDSNAATTDAVLDSNAATKADAVLDSNTATKVDAVLDSNAATKKEAVLESKAISIDQATVDAKDKSSLQTDSSNLNDQATQSEPLRSLDISANNEVSMSNNQAQSAIQNLQTMDATVTESKLTKSPNVEAIIIPATFYEDNLSKSKVDISNQQRADADVIRTNALDKSDSLFVNALGQSVESKTVDSGKSDLHGGSKGELPDTLALSQVAEEPFTDKSGPPKSYETKTVQTSDQLAGKEGVVVYMPIQTQAATGTALDQQDTSVLIKEVPVVQYEATDAISTVLETSTLVDGIIPVTTEKDISDKSYTQTTKLESTIPMETTEGKQTISEQSTILKTSDKLVKPVPTEVIKNTTDGAQSIMQTMISEELLQQQPLSNNKPLVEGSPSIDQTMTSKDVDGVVVKEYSSKSVEGQTDLVFSATPEKVDIIPVSHETNTVKKIDETLQYEVKGLANTEKYDLTFETAKNTDTTEPMVKTTLSPFFASESPSVPIMDEQNIKTESVKIENTTEPVVKTTLSPFIASEAPSVPIIDEQTLKTESAIIVDTTEHVLKTTLSPFIANEAPSVPIIDEQSLKTESATIVDTNEPVIKTTLSPFIASEAPSVPIIDEQSLKTESAIIVDTTEPVLKTTLSPFIASEAPSVPIIDEQSLKTESAIIVDTTESVLKTTLSPFIASEAPSVPIIDEQSLKTESATIVDTTESVLKTTLSPFIASEAPSVPIIDEQSLKTESAIIVDTTVPVLKTTLSPFIASEAPSVPMIDEQSLKTDQAVVVTDTIQTEKPDKLSTESKLLSQTSEPTSKPATAVTQKTAMPDGYPAATGIEKFHQQLELETTNVRATESKPVKESRVATKTNEPINELSRDLYHRSMQMLHKAANQQAEDIFGVNKDRKQNLVQQYEPEVTSPALETLCGNSMFIDGIGYAEYPGYCDKLVQCYTHQQKVTAVQRECPYGYFWHQDQVLCRPPAEVPCYDDPCLDIDIVQYNRSGGCRSYYRCDYGISVPQCCEKGFRYDSYGCVPDPTCRDPCMTPYDLQNRMQFQSCKFLPDEYNPYGYLTLEHNGLRIRACPEGTEFSARQCGCRRSSGSRHVGRRRIRECQPDFYMNFNYGFKELSGSNMAFDVHNVVINDGAAQFNGNGRITLWGFMNKELGKKFAIRIRFKPDPKATGKGNLISNCGMTGTATVAIGLENHKVKLVAKSNSFSRRTIINSHFDPYSWNDITYVYNGNSFVAAIDGYRSRKPLGGLLETRSNAIVIGGCPKPGSGYKGLIDSIEVFSGCIPRNIYKPRKQR